jgi:pullulanase
MDKLAQTAVLTAQGLPFIFAGEELFRTKGGDENSYRSPDSVNAIDWHNKQVYNDLFKYYQGLINLRTSHPEFWPNVSEPAARPITFLDSPESVVMYRIDASENSLLVALNGSAKPSKVKVPAGTILASGGKSGLSEPFKGGSRTLAPYEALILLTRNN